MLAECLCEDVEDVSTSLIYNIESVNDGTCFILEDNIARYTPKLDFFGTDTFTYSCTDSHGANSINNIESYSYATVNITIISDSCMNEVNYSTALLKDIVNNGPKISIDIDMLKSINIMSLPTKNSFINLSQDENFKFKIDGALNIINKTKETNIELQLDMLSNIKNIEQRFYIYNNLPSDIKKYVKYALHGYTNNNTTWVQDLLEFEKNINKSNIFLFNNTQDSVTKKYKSIVEIDEVIEGTGISR